MSRTIPIYIILGTRAQFIKMAPLLNEMQERHLNYHLIYTAQHSENIQEILDTYRLPKPDTIMFQSDEANTISKASNWAARMFFSVIFKSKTFLPEQGVVLVHGDTFSTWLGALMGKIAGCSVAHVESGLRSFNLFNPFPEEISRLLTFSLSNIYFCSDEWAINNLKRYKGEKVNIFGNTLLDGIKYALNNENFREFDFMKEPFALVSIHRSENLFTSKFNNFIIPTIINISKQIKIIFTLHPTTRERLQSLNLYNQLERNHNIVLHSRFSFLDWIYICSKSEFVITDGGSNQEELSYLGIPTLLFRETTERQEGLGKNIVLSKFNKEVIRNFLTQFNDLRKNLDIQNYSPSKIIVDYLINRFSPPLGD